MKRKLFAAALLSACCNGSIHAQCTITGKVVDAENNEPVAGATVRLRETNIGCTTDDRGAFTLRNVPEGNHVMRVSRLDYTPQTQTVSNNDENVLVRMREDVVSLNQVVVTGTGTHHRLKDSPVPVEVITQKELQQANAANIEDALLKLVPSISFQSTSMSNNIYMNGLSGKYVLVMVNGRKLAGDTSGNIDFSRIDPARVKRIEIIKGAASALYGSDAIAGVINIITNEDTSDLINVTSDTRVSSHGRISESVNADVNIGKFSSHTAYRRQQSDGWKLSDYEEEDDGTLAETDKQPVYHWFTNDFSQSFTYRPTERLSIDVFGTYSTYENDRSPAVAYNIKHKTYQYGGTAKYRLPHSSYLELGANTTNYRSFQQYTKASGGHDEGENMNSKDQDYTNAYLKGVFKLGNANMLNVGLDYVGDALKSTGTSNLGDMKDRTMYTLAFYAQDEIKITSGLSAVAGFRYIYHETFKSRFDPKVSLMYKWGDLNLRASYASAFRAPTLQQLYAISEKSNKITMGSLDLKAEHSNFYNLNAEYNNKYVSASVSVYQNDIRNLIDYKEMELTAEDHANGIISRKAYANIGKARIQGFDVGFNVRPGGGFTFGATYNYTHAQDLIADTPLERSMRHAATCNAGWSKQWGIYTLNVNVFGRYQGTRWSDTYDSSPAFQTWDLTTRHVVRLKAFTLEPGLGVENIFNYRDDRPYNSHYATVTPGRSFFASLLVRFRQ